MKLRIAFSIALLTVFFSAGITAQEKRSFKLDSLSPKFTGSSPAMRN
jgi:hypothetical protein